MTRSKSGPWGLIRWCGMVILLAAVSATATADMAAVEAFLARRTDVYENIRNWSGKSDKVWILREWVKITTERNADYDEARRILAQLDAGGGGGDDGGNGGGNSAPGSENPGSPGRPAPGVGWDDRLDRLGVKLIPARVPAGQLYWKLIDARWQDESEAGGRHAIHFEPLTEDGGRDLDAQPMVNGEKVRNDRKPPPEYMANFPMYKALGAYSAWMDGLPSDRITGLGLGSIEQPAFTIHTCFMLKFQQVRAGGEQKPDGNGKPQDGFPPDAVVDDGGSRDDDGGSVSGDVGGDFGTLSINGQPSDRPADQHPDLNLSIRGWKATQAQRSLTNVGGDTDDKAPKFRTFFDPPRLPTFTSTHRMYDWDWGGMKRGGLLSKWEVTLLGMGTRGGEVLRVPTSGYSIGSGKMVLVIFATQDQITLKYTREDNIVSGYAVHVVGVAVDPKLLSLYQKCVREGRRAMPALAGGQPFGRARGGEILVAIRDTGEFMDPRIEKDWW